MELDFYYWGDQCPVIRRTFHLLRHYREKFNITMTNIDNDPEMAKKMGMYFPFLTVVNGNLRIKGPLKEQMLDEILAMGTFKEKPNIVDQGKEIFEGSLEKLSADNIDLLAPGCTVGEAGSICHYKKDFLKSKLGHGFFGYLNISGGKVVGGAEYLPSMAVPYHIPRSADTAFLTCIYHSSPRYDYKASPLEQLEKALAGSYQFITAITDFEGTFPNGNLQWFLNQGFEDCGVVSVEEEYCELHLVKKAIC